MPVSRIYLDHNATTPIRPQVRHAIYEALEHPGNASSVHAEGRAAHKALDEARGSVALLVGALPGMIVFTSGGTEANNMALKGAPVDRLIVSASEHVSGLDAAYASAKSVDVLPVSSTGLVDLDALENRLADADGKALVSVMLANNETGVIQPIARIAAIARRYGALVHTDAVQAAGKIPVSMPLLGVDLMTLSAHKLGGPQGIGALVVNDGVALDAMIHGGGQEMRRRSGTQNLPGIEGFAAAARASRIDMYKFDGEIRRLRDRLEAHIMSVAPSAVLFGGDVERLPNTSCFAVPGLSAEMLLMAFDLDGVAVSSGAACSSGKVARSHVLDAMGVEPAVAEGAIRVSLGWNSTMADVDRFAGIWRLIAERHKDRVAA